MTIPFLVFVSVAALQGAPPPPPPPPPGAVPRDAGSSRAPATATAIIRGRVTDLETGRPIAGALVGLTPVGGGNLTFVNSGRYDPIQTVSGPDGRFELRDLAAGSYSLAVRPGEFRATHLTQTYGENRPGDPRRLQRPKPFTIRDGEIREDLDVALWRTFAIEGRVVDDYGEALAGVALHVTYAGTSRRVPTVGPFQFHTDDRGHFRIYGLAPGQYNVCANPARHFQLRSDDLKERFVDTCHPAVIGAAGAEPVTVANGDVQGVDIRMQRSRAFTATGLVMDASGAPLGRATVSLVRMENNNSFSSSGLVADPDGRFTARGLVPGEYAIRAEIGSRYDPEDKREREVAYVPFRIENADIEGLVVSTRKLARISGRVVLEGGSAIPAGTALQVTTRVENRYGMLGPPPSARVKPDFTFELSDLFGPLAIQVNGSRRDLVLKQIKYRGRDVTETFVDFADARDTDTLEIVLTNRVARITGRVLDESGTLSHDAWIFVLPADPARWHALTTLRPTGAVAQSGVKPDGSYQIGPLRAGEYLIVALRLEDTPIAPVDVAAVERLAGVAQRITVVENEEVQLDLPLRKPR